MEIWFGGHIFFLNFADDKESAPCNGCRSALYIVPTLYSYTHNTNMKKLNFFGVSALLCAMAVPAVPAHAADPVLYGYQGNFNGGPTKGLFTFTPSGFSQDLLWRDELAYTESGAASGAYMLGGWIRNGRLCGYESYYPTPSLDYYKYIERDLETGEVLLEQQINTTGQNWGNVFLYATYCPVDDRIYGYGFNKTRTAYVFKSAPSNNLDQAVTIREVQYKEMARSLCFNEDLGILVGMTGQVREGSVVEPVRMVQIDVNTGVQTELYQPNVVPDYDVASGLVWLRDRKAYAWNFYTEEESETSRLMLLDPQTKATEILRQFPSTYHFSYIIAGEQTVTPETNSPKTVTGLTYEFDKSGDHGTFTFTLPSQLNNGETISGNVNYTVYSDNKQLTTGSGAAGAQVTTGNVSLSKGTHFVRVVPEVNGKAGLADLITVFIGADNPEAPTNVTLAGTTLSWDAVTKGVHGGQLSNVTYEILYKDQIVDDTSATTFDASEIINTDGPLTAYSFQVQAVANNLRSKPILSNSVIEGRSYTVPFTIEPTEEQFSVCTLEDTDGNNVSWTLDKRDYDDHNVLTSGFDADRQSEDWLFLPRFTAPADGIYNFNFNVALADADYNGGILEVWVGTEPSSEGMKKCILPAMAQYDYSPLNLSAEFVIDGELAQAKDLYIGLCVKTEQGTLSPLRFETLKLTKSVNNLEGPEAVKDLKTTVSPESPLMANVSFILPDRTLDGKSIPATNTVSARVKSSNGMSKTVSGAPGETQEFTMDLGTGDFLITVTPTWNDKTGLSANTVAALGFGLPGRIRNLRAEYDETDTKLTLRWDCPATDVNGKPSEDDFFSYNVYSYDESEDGFVLQVTVPYPLDYATMDMGGADMSLTNIDVRITAVNQTGESPYDEGISVTVGKPYDLPMTEDFNGSDFRYKPMTIMTFGDYGKAQLTWTSPSKSGLTGDMLAGLDGDFIMGTPTELGAKTRIVIPKFSTMGFENATVNCKFWTGKDAAEIDLSAFGYPMSSAEEQVFGKVAGGDGYTTVRFPLPDDMTMTPWVQVFVNASYPSLSSKFIFCEYNIDNGAGVDGVINGGVGVVRGGVGEIFISGYSDVNAAVYTLDGKLVAQKALNGDDETIEVAAGFYVVKIGNYAVKVVVS